MGCLLVVLPSTDTTLTLRFRVLLYYFDLITLLYPCCQLCPVGIKLRSPGNPTLSEQRSNREGCIFEMAGSFVDIAN